jgi:hypothetical protein
MLVGASSSRPWRSRRLAVALLAALTVASVTAGSVNPAQAVPSPAGPAGTIQTMGGATRNFAQGGYGPEGVLASESQFLSPRGLGFAPNGDIYITDALNHRVRKIDSNGVVSLVAGNGTPGFSGDGADATLAQLNEPHGVAVDTEGNVYIADSKNCVIRKVSGGIITRHAGTGAKNTNGACTKTADTDGPILTIALDQPKSLFMTRNNGDDTLWIADMGNSQIKMIDVDSADPQNVRVAGNNRVRHYSDGSPSFDAKEADLRHPEGIWVANDGTIYFTDGGNNLVRKIEMPAANSSLRKISTIAGDVGMAEANKFGAEDLPGDSDGDGGLAVNAHLDKPRGIAGDNLGNLYVAEEHGSRIRRINLGSGIINTVAGDGTILEQRANGGSVFIKGENGPALDTQFAMLHDIQLNPADGSLWIADSRNNRVRAISDMAHAPGRNVPTGGGTPTAVRPGAPTSVTATPGNGSATVTWTAPAADGGSPITSYTVTSSSGRTTSVNGATLTTTMTGLSNGTAYTFTVRATNSVGNGAASAPSNSVVPTTTPPPARPPGAPTVGTATGLVSSNRAVGVAAVSWSAPSDDGGNPISSYLITATPGGQTTLVGAPGTTAVVSNLQNGTTYTFTVQAQNSVGLSPPSAATGPAAPYSYPAPVPGVTATVSDSTAVIRWDTPADDGGRPITGYQVTAETLDTRAAAGGRTAATAPLTVTAGAAQRTATLTGLDPATQYSFSVVANNEAGASQVIPSSTTTGASAVGRSGYWMVGSDGVVYPFGDPKAFGNALTGSAVDLEPTPSGNGYWIVDAGGAVFAFGDAVARGDVDRSKLVVGEKVTSLSATGDGGGYWIFTSRGRVLTFGNAAHLGDVSTLTLAGPVLDSIVTPSGQGYYMVASDGGIFAFGDAKFYGSMGGQKLNAPVQSLVPDADGVGYWLVASDGGIFAFQAEFKGSMGGTRLNKPVTGMVRAGRGYLMVGEDGGIFDFSGDPTSFKGSLGANPPARPITSVAVLESHP